MSDAFTRANEEIRQLRLEVRGASGLRNLLRLAELSSARIEDALRELLAATSCLDPARCAEFWDPTKQGRGLCAHCRATTTLKRHKEDNHG